MLDVSLDVNSPRGQETLRQEQRCFAIFEAANPGWRFLPTAKNGRARADGFLLCREVIRAVVEQKSRTCSLATLRGSFRNEWLVTFDKLDAIRIVAEALAIPAYGLLYLVPDDVVLVQKIVDDDGNWVAQFRVEETVTQATVNGGSATRMNAFIDMRDARVLVGGFAKRIA